MGITKPRRLSCREAEEIAEGLAGGRFQFAYTCPTTWGMGLRGKAKDYSASYDRSRRAIFGRMAREGLPVEVVWGERRKYLVMGWLPFWAAVAAKAAGDRRLGQLAYQLSKAEREEDEVQVSRLLREIRARMAELAMVIENSEVKLFEETKDRYLEDSVEAVEAFAEACRHLDARKARRIFETRRGAEGVSEAVA